MKTTKFKTPEKIEVGSYIAKRTMQINGKCCAMCGREIGDASMSTLVYMDNCEPRKGDEVQVTRGEHLHAWHILTNGGGAMDAYIGNECIKKIVWREEALTEEERQEVEDYG